MAIHPPVHENLDATPTMPGSLRSEEVLFVQFVGVGRVGSWIKHRAIGMWPVVDGRLKFCEAQKGCI